MATNFTRNYVSKCVTARITRSRQLYSEHFSLTKYSTWERAERAARRWLKEIRPQLPDAITSKGRLTRRNESGVVGVQLRARRIGSEQTEQAWMGSWPGQPGGSSWSVAKYGDNRAFVCAVLARRLETTDRDEVEAEFQRIKGTPDYRRILRSKALSVS